MIFNYNCGDRDLMVLFNEFDHTVYSGMDGIPTYSLMA